MSRIEVQGSVAPGFESVKQRFEQQTNTLAEDNAQLCVYHRGQKVVDLWASATADDRFDADSLVNIFSSGKSLESIAIAALVSKGLIDYDTPIVQYWPEFGGQGKEDVTIADVLRHESGMANFDVSLEAEDVYTENIKQNAVGKVIEQHGQRFTPLGKREYHAITRGWIVNEVFRRVDPAGRTIGEFLREDIKGPMGVDVVVGVSEADRERMFPVKPLGFGFQLLQGFVPRFLGRKVVHNIFQVLTRLAKIVAGLFKGGRQSRPPPAFTQMKSLAYFNHPDWGRGETSSANATCSARGLAKLGAMLSGGGALEGREYLTPGAWQAMHDKPVEGMLGPIVPTRFTQGGVDKFIECGPGASASMRAFNEGREGFYGWMGLGGSLFQWNPALDIGFAFVPTALHYLDLLNERGKVYQAEVLRCVRKLEEETTR